jgi:Capsule assembly protein Wzi
MHLCFPCLRAQQAKSVPLRAADPAEDKQRSPSNMASTYVPLDSWIYPAFERLTALGYVQTGFVGLRPWTRMECARQLMEAEDLGAGEAEASVQQLYRGLLSEFALEMQRLEGATSNRGLQLESVYTRFTGISGQPLIDGYHFAQTINSDFGRPYGGGANWYAGGSTRAVAGPFAFYVRAEYQDSSPSPAVPLAAQTAIALADFTPTAAAGPVTGYARGQLLDAYVSVDFKNNQLSFGRQSLWWGPTYSSPLLFSDNALPIPMLRYDRVKPFKLPGFLGVVGPIRMQFFVGQLSGQQFVKTSTVIGQSGRSLNPQPYINGAKISFKPLPDLEFSLSKTTIFGGPGFPVTWNSFWRSVFSTSESPSSNDPGDRRTAFDAQYRIPGLRNWLTFYCDAFADDEVFPLAQPNHSVWAPGFYLPKLPHIGKLDFRAEGVVTPERLFPGFFYFNVHYLSGYTNDRQLIGGWIGRQGSGFQVWSTYWMSARSKIQASYRGAWVDHSFLQGGWVKDASVQTEFSLRPDISLQASVQYERWSFPLLSTSRMTNVASSVQITYAPTWRRR